MKIPFRTLTFALAAASAFAFSAAAQEPPPPPLAPGEELGLPPAPMEQVAQAEAPEPWRATPPPGPPPGRMRAPLPPLGPPQPTPAPAPPGMPRPRDPFPWWKDSQLASELKLTSDQTQRLEKSFLDFRLQLIDLRAELERQEARFGILVDADDLDLPAATKQAAEVARARAELERGTTVMLLSLRRELSVEQWKTLQRHEERNRPRAPMPPPAPTPY